MKIKLLFSKLNLLLSYVGCTLDTLQITSHNLYSVVLVLIYANLSFSLFPCPFSLQIQKVHTQTFQWLHMSFRMASKSQSIQYYQVCMLANTFCILNIEHHIFLSEILFLNTNRTIEIGADRFKIPDILFNPPLAQVHGSWTLTMPIPWFFICIFCHSSIFILIWGDVH